MTARQVNGVLMLGIWVWLLATSDLLHQMAAGLVHNLPEVLLGLLALPVALAATIPLLASLVTIRHR